MTIHNQEQTHLITQICLLAGKIILQNGGETYRVEDTMARIASAYGIPSSQSFVTPTGLIFAIDGHTQITRLIRISDRSTNLLKVSLVNDISRRICNGDLEAEEAHRLLQQLDVTSYDYSNTQKVIAAVIACGCFVIMFQGTWADFLPAAFIGGFAYLFFLIAHYFVPIKFFAEFLTSIMVGILAVLAVSLGLGQDLDKIIIGSVMPLVPGLHITNAVRDLMAGHLVSGLSKGAEAFLTAFAIGAGIATVLAFY
ncbi:threonine/serine exporter family protein [Paenibacillus sp. GSMTC-2017]|uniref:threonine/serine exporter family protein n=1 Tax=Paenibacillus sp. GSMTC-2017 TaxID=2794350 RepID=UPI0018D5FCF6|nr:threonine/serine exporter family protein [Paenibacillus sp. GSMTC-2017]MBH5318492.1 threonine/serine exporter family protein [Paenibacillus sp. GSMTC-2017]